MYIMNRNKGFTLIELSVVIVIIGLIVAGIVGGQSLVRQAKIRSVVTDLNKYHTAFNTFRLEYDGYPGDIKNAEDYWGSDASCPNTPTNTVPKQATCNGDGNGKVGWIGTYYEMQRAWQHLANADIIPGQYAGARGPADTLDHEININCPAGPYEGTGYAVEYTATSVGDGSMFAMSMHKHTFWFGKETAHRPQGQALKPKELFVLEQKIDDKLPAKGIVRAYSWSTCTDAANNADLDSEYDLTNDNIGCALLYLFD